MARESEGSVFLGRSLAAPALLGATGSSRYIHMRFDLSIGSRAEDSHAHPPQLTVSSMVVAKTVRALNTRPIWLGVRCGGSKGTARLALPQPRLEVYRQRSRACRMQIHTKKQKPAERAPSHIVGASTIHCFIPDPHPWIPNQRGVDANGQSEMMSEPEVARAS